MQTKNMNLPGIISNIENNTNDNIMGQTVKQKMITKSKKAEEPVRIPFGNLLNPPQEKPKPKKK
jgi:hypothetical protein